ncbi:MAG: hypothetical protein LBQ79_07655 [Deltaproteobacteria bacterium]|jgi:transposase|nr:hypothetical protein [Deltaproteobacteria bacterium]
MARPAEHPHLDFILLNFFVGWIRSRTFPTFLTTRTKTVLLSNMGFHDRDIADVLILNKNSVTRWRKRFLAFDIEGSPDAPRSGKSRKYDHDQLRKDILKIEREEKPPHYFYRWFNRQLAERLEVSESFIGRVKRDSRIQTNRTKSWCVGKHPQFSSKSADVITRYLNTEPNAVVVSVDKMTGVQALERKLGLIVVRGSLFFGMSW